MKIQKHKKLISKISVGTANFGTRYGFKNKKVSKYEIKKIINIIKKYNIKYLDTAIDYKNADIELGKLNLKNFSISSKIPKIPKDQANTFIYVTKIVKNHIKNMGISKIDTLFIHDVSIIKQKNFKEISRALTYLKKIKLIKKIGISIYNPSDIEKIYKIIKFNSIQTTFNIFDQNILSKNYLNFFNKNKIKLEVRSIFLQGLLLNKKKFYKNFPNKIKLFNSLDKFINEKKISKLKFLINYTFNFKVFDKIIIGIDTAKHLIDIINLLEKKKNIMITKFISKDSKFIYPYNWKYEK